jgi:hypothetical protein
MKPKIKNIFLSTNGSIAVCDESGQQIAELQRDLISDWCEKAVALGYDPNGVILETELGDLRIVKNSDGTWNRQAA